MKLHRVIGPNHVRRELTGRGLVDMTAVVGAKDRASNQFAANVVTSTDKGTLQGFMEDNRADGATF